MREAQAEALDREILTVIIAWHHGGAELSDAAFSELALRLFAYQLRYNERYARYCATKGVTFDRMPASWRDIPAVPAAAFKESEIATFAPHRAALIFETSGTTQGRGGRHYMENARLYDASLLAGFDTFMLPDGARLRYLNLVPNPQQQCPTSSLGYMMGRVSEQRGVGRTGWYLRGDTLLADDFFRDLREAMLHAQPVCIAATAFSLLATLDAADERSMSFRLPYGSRIMETGGFKGKVRAVSRDELYERASCCFGVDADHIVAEYGMTELTSQYYDATLRQAQGDMGQAQGDMGQAQGDMGQAQGDMGQAQDDIAQGDSVTRRMKHAPTWLRGRAVGPDGSTLPDGVAGALVHVDLANRSSCIAIQTEDLGVRYGDRIELLGRDAGAELRGCSLDAESLHAQ